MSAIKRLNGPLGGFYGQKGESTTLIEETTRVINVTSATYTITEAEAGALFLCNRAGGIAFTLPAIAPGLKYRFLVQTTFTGSGTITAAAGDLLIGGVTMVSASNVCTGYWADNSDDLILTMNGTTTGGLFGSYIEVEAVGKFGIDGRWVVTGFNKHSDSVATPFS